MRISEVPQINLSRSTYSRMWLVNLCAALAIIQSALSDRGASLVVAIAALAGSAAPEFFFNIRNTKHRLDLVKNGSAVTTALVLTLLLPNTIHPYTAFLGAIFASLVVKYSFGGLGANWFNPALGGWFFIRLSWPQFFSEALSGSVLQSLYSAIDSGLTDINGSPLNLVKTAGFPAGSLGGAVTQFFNDKVFASLPVVMPEGYIDLLFSSEPGIIADRGLAALILGTIIIASSQVSRVWVSAIFLTVYVSLVRIFGALPLGGPVGGGDMLFGIFTGGIIAAAFMLLGDPVTGPKTRRGSAAAAVLAGFFAFILRYPGNEPFGAFYAIAMVNTLAPLIRGMENFFFFKKPETV